MSTFSFSAARTCRNYAHGIFSLCQELSRTVLRWSSRVSGALVGYESLGRGVGYLDHGLITHITEIRCGASQSSQRHGQWLEA